MLVLSLSLCSSNSDVLEKSQYLSALFSEAGKRKKNHQSLERHSVAEIYSAANGQVTLKCTFCMSKIINTVLLSPHCFRDGQPQPFNMWGKERLSDTEKLREINSESERERKRDWWWRGVNVCARLIPPRWEVREECFQGLQQHPSCSFLRMHGHERKLGAGRVAAEAHRSTLTSCPSL